MLRLAVPNKGALSEPAAEMLREAGYKTRRTGRELVLMDEANGVELFFLRPRDIAQYVGQGTVAAGITGRDLLLDSGVDAVEHMPLGFAHSTFRFAAPRDTISRIEDIAGKRVATSYDVLVDTYLKVRGITAEVVHLDGAVESSVQLGIADLVADVVETGSTLRAAGLHVFGEAILQSEAVLITTEAHVDNPHLRILERRLQGVMVARSYVLIEYNAPEDAIEAVTKVTPGVESPTVSPLAESGWKAVRVMVKRKDMNRIMDELYLAGARGILVTEIMATRL
ncbi:MAG: ATP phosphoribosyltransferase [Actinomycetaceae bacterium]|nr:ATP phosphoribosyltransferase [Actinomycetaceae bacterium]